MKESFINYYWFQYWHIIVFGELTMVYCHNCGKKLDEDTQYCTKCGHDLGHESSFEKNMENFGEKIGEKAEQFGRKIEKKADDFGDHINHLYDRTFRIAGKWYAESFKIAGPLIGAFIALIILRIVIYVIQASDEDIFIVTTLGEGLLEYLLFIFASMLLSGYNTYFHRKYKHRYQWIYPLISAIGFIIGAWIAAQIMLLISQSNDTPIIKAIGTFINTYLIGIFIIALVIGYAAQFYKFQEGKSRLEVKHCSNCKIDVDSDAVFCWKCGKEI